MKRIASVTIVALLTFSLLCACATTAEPLTNIVETVETAEPAPVTVTADNADVKSTEWSDAKINAEDVFAPCLTEGLDYLILVNKGHAFEFGGDYDKLLHEHMTGFADAKDGDLIYLDAGAYAAFTALQAYLDNDYDFQIGIYDAYRDYETQARYFTTFCRAMWGDLKDDSMYDGYRDWQGKNPLAEPGYSETHTGLLLNVLIKHDRIVPQPIDAEFAEQARGFVERIGYVPDWEWYTESAERQETIERFEILREHLADFGFIERYPAGKEARTGVPCEPYQIRFVGSSKIAHEIMDSGLSLEEYLGETAEYDPYAKPSDDVLRKYISMPEPETPELDVEAPANVEPLTEPTA